MTESSLRPVPGYGDVLDNFNRVPFLFLADRVRRDIMLPVLDRRSDSLLNRSNAKFIRSSNGSALLDKKVVELSFIEQVNTSLTADAGSVFKRFDLPGLWVGVFVSSVTGDVTTITLTGLADDTVKVCTFGDPTFWFPCIQYGFMIKCNGTGDNKAYFSMYSFA